MDATALGTALWRARLKGTHVPVDAAMRAFDEATCYRAQDAMIAASKARVIGWKLGATTLEAQRILQVAGPFYGEMVDRFAYASGASVPIEPKHSPAIEGEFAVRMGASLPPRRKAYSRKEVAAAIASVGPALEIIGCRLAGPITEARQLLIPDAAANMAFVRGRGVGDWQRFNLRKHPLTLAINGKVVAEGHSGMTVFGSTLDAMVWLANRLRERDRGLRRGEIITTGTCTGVVSVKPGDEAAASYGAMGRVACRFRAARRG
jgi:2-keto-4-pentenoate hydratase